MRKILIVDDQQKVRALLEVTISMGDFEILHASSGEEGLRKARECMPDIILLDVMMPGLDGIEVCRLLKKDPATKDIYIIMLTARGQQADKKKGFDAGADEYFTKPFSPMDLINKIDKIFESKTVKREIG
ncbi:MAG TPA: response regulator [Anaerolineae bacterium]|nr:response regulator [Anaerolineae bacterium]